MSARHGGQVDTGVRKETRIIVDVSRPIIHTQTNDFPSNHFLKMLGRLTEIREEEKVIPGLTIDLARMMADVDEMIRTICRLQGLVAELTTIHLKPVLPLLRKYHLVKVSASILHAPL